MRTRIHAVVLPSDTAEFADDLRRLMSELEADRAAEGLNGEFSPPLDVYETDDMLEIVVDLPGVDRRAVRIAATGSAILIAGLKSPRRYPGESSFHLVERGYGRFARAVRLTRPANARAASASLAGGELRVSIPKIADRRGRSIPIALTPERDAE